MERYRRDRGIQSVCDGGLFADSGVERDICLVESREVVAMRLKLAMMAVVLITSGCAIGNGHICGPQTPAFYCDREAYEKLMHPKPYIENWEKQGATSEMRDRDSENCGGSYGKYAPGFSQEKVKAAQRPGEKDNVTYSRLHHEWQRCMLKKGYRYTGECYSQSSPACGAP
ncbi:hypothetical protein [Ralstonia solanacearum]|uniref:hypothetical protein n=1 Tax=Ralstonia solanacearum TaxID=305 RepID=UPI001E3E3138|nr:hypothetical protein [Ralstonia solanacearum]